jgi:hypothetical protein
VKEFSKGLERIVDLKKIEAMSPEAQAAAVSRGSIDGNVTAEPKRETEPQGTSSAQRSSVDGNGAHQDTVERKEVTEEKMDLVIQDMLKKPLLKSVLQEWALHVETENDATTFANFYMEMMRDQKNDESRQACAGFATYMKPRNWDLMFRSIAPHLDPDVLRAFKTPYAKDFYEQFRAMVIEQIKEYWEQFLAARSQQAQLAAAAKGQSAPSADTTSAAVGQGEGSRVPTREALLPQK